ncbi:MAG: 3-methyl-2-oxobutanoate dehydrogenase subunit VorB [Candidatus Omnitrophica bacterium]|nr:3-methyl-2-oxobutanoate dehydrogenase subunit VorB [Candidatus Omnitrophota bacterium]MBU1870351.1 3-methyl-2-oxobutanoate dehydrogenase subunit VorB [Candidatus Omnitrophota bacterium]
MKVLISGNEAIAEGAIQAGCSFYAGYPITPQNEIPAYMSVHMPQAGGVFIQAESELAAINMVYGASATGVRSMTSSSSPGVSLKQEGISYIAGAELPAVIVNIMRGGPGLGNIAPSQSDYFQATHGGGHGDYRLIVLAPATVQEAYDFMSLGFSLAEKYRNPAMILGDGMLAQMMEPINIKKSRIKNQKYARPWALTGCRGRKPNIVKSFYMQEGDLEKFNLHLQEKYKTIEAQEQRHEGLFLDDAEIVLVSYGSMSRIAKGAVQRLREKGKKVGLLRPVSLWPFPKKAFGQIRVHPGGRLKFLVIEMSYGQMLNDVKLALNCKYPVEFLGRAGGGIPTEDEIIKRTLSLLSR